MRSTDGGNTWAQVPGSKFATNISAFFFPPTGAVWMSTNGRGLWTMALDRKPNGPAGQRCRFPGSRGIIVPVDSVIAINPATGFASPFSGPRDSVVCPRCTIVTVRNGWVTQLDQSGDSVRRIGISGGTISQVDRDGREVRLTIPNRYVAGSGQSLGKLSRATIGEERRIRALVMDGTRLVRLIASRDELTFAPTREPMVFVRGSTHGGSAVMAGDSVRVGGTGFVAPAAGGGPVEILFDGQTVARDVSVAADGSFTVTLPVRRPPGELVVTAQQRDGQRTSVERASIDVLGNDEQANPPPPG
jgi:hypothetical protein